MILNFLATLWSIDLGVNILNSQNKRIYFFHVFT
jgi:hypothetical protein